MKASDEILAEMTRRLVAELQPEQIILFGSQAWGTPDEGSDVDLFIVMPDSHPVTRERVVAAQLCLGDLGIPKDVILRNRADVERFRPVAASLEALVYSLGRVLYDRSDEADRERLAHSGAAGFGSSA